MTRIFHPRLALHRFYLLSITALSLLSSGTPLTNLHGQNGSLRPHSVTVNWSRSVSPVAGYNVYRADPGGAPVKLTSKLVSVTRYVDRNVKAGRTYTYTITAVDIKGAESDPSTSITVTVPGPATPASKQ